MSERSWFPPSKVALLLAALLTFLIVTQTASARAFGELVSSAPGTAQVLPQLPDETGPTEPVPLPGQVEPPMQPPDPGLPPAPPLPEEPVPPPSEPPPPPPAGTPFDPAPAQLCAADLNGNGDAADSGEVAACMPTASAPGWLCPLQQMACEAQPDGQFSCPLGDQHGCAVPLGGGAPSCSPNLCADPAANPVEQVPPIDDAGTPADGGVDAEGNCLGRIEIFSGRGMRCRPPGLGVTFKNCCKDKGRIIKDGMGSSITSIGTKIAVVKGVFNGMSAAFAAFKAGATANQAASAGANALILGFDPTSIAISLAINFMVELLFSGCDQQDMETAMLRGSGMCHEVGSYCTASFLGICLQKAKGHCCFNTKLGRIIQEQGRPQLKSFNGVGWGTPRKPRCRGFTPEEFQALDFAKMDLSEYYADIESRAASQIQIDMKDKIDAYLNAVGE
ncbi:conjugal transfer protein TraN [Sphingomonas sp. MG17]|uniref:Conjugal transfer protein TraN n=1 Tax=Sphingomonas tagetis TaxID=2949092 RepID=A0A9X2KMU9_9SPHN|nr:conjugal transfer protein TraN [Sphingomonas tagetis]MCP3732190.1 conjugal transfer protein TraN [Sphingomonas tagetis]